MAGSSNQELFFRLREEYPVFTFESQHYTVKDDAIEIRFTFDLAGKIRFHPELRIPRKHFFLPDEVFAPSLDSLIFQIGMIELVSYWKAACPPKVVIKPFYLDDWQVAWWKQLYYNGLGEFFYLNGIVTGMDDFMKIDPVSDATLTRIGEPAGKGSLIPVGGGKDSAVTLDLLGKQPGAVPMIINPRGASLDCVTVSGFSRDQLFEVERTIDPELIRLNGLGFLNGHTPFSAMLAFVTLLSAIVTGCRDIALSNESSANEATIEGTNINHQYSKSLQFETDFREYLARYISPGLNYFSLLRPLNELQIASLFSRLTDFHPVFRSCNAGSKTNSWCGRCPKCLFTAIILSPFIPAPRLHEIFGKDLFNDPELRGFLDQLTGIANEKPFDCVGTVREVNIALCETIRKYSGRDLPLLLQYYRETPDYARYSNFNFQDSLRLVINAHHLPAGLFDLLTERMEA